MTITTQLMTAEEFWQRANEFPHCELVNGIVVPKHRADNGEAVMSPTGGQHGKVAGNFYFYLRQFVQAHQLGTVFAAETGFYLSRNPDVIRAPDVAYISKERLTTPPKGFVPLAPDLAVEVVSPGDTEAEVHAKVIEFLRAGTRLVLVAYSDTRTITGYRSFSDVRVLTEDDLLEGADVLPGFSILVRQFFD